VTPEAWLDANEDAALKTLKAFCAIPSVSTDPAYATDMANAAAFLASHLTAIGLDHAIVRPTDGHSIVTADWLHAPGAPTILVYAHYDVQPPDPLALWESPPFTATIRNDRLYGRGVSDDKGPMMVALTAIAARIATNTLSVNLKLLIEGEEECGSRNLNLFVADHAALLAADWVLSADGARWRADLPTTTVASRGLCALEVTVKGADRDLHSGRYGGMVANPVAVLARLLAGLHDDAGGIAVPGFMDGITAAISLDDVPFDEAAQAATLGASALTGEAGYSALQRNWLRPTLEFNGIWGGYAGPGSKTVIPAVAGAKITCRLVPGQEPERVAKLIATDLRRRIPHGVMPGVTVDVTIEDHEAMPYAIPDDHAGLALAEAVVAEIEGRTPLRVRMGATLPMCDILRRRLGIDTVMFSFSTADEDYHAPNEFFRLSSWRTGLRAWVTLLGRAGPGRTAS